MLILWWVSITSSSRRWYHHRNSDFLLGVVKSRRTQPTALCCSLPRTHPCSPPVCVWACWWRSWGWLGEAIEGAFNTGGVNRDTMKEVSSIKQQAREMSLCWRWTCGTVWIEKPIRSCCCSAAWSRAVEKLGRWSRSVWRLLLLPPNSQKYFLSQESGRKFPVFTLSSEQAC